MPGDVVVRIASDADTVAARQAGREVALRLGFTRTEATFIATAISEISRNILAHAGDGEVLIREARRDGRVGIVVVARDEGPGIKDVEAVLQQAFGTGIGLGMGLWGARRLMDDLRIESRPGHGTSVTMTKWRGIDEVGLLLADRFDD